jgi:uncharacterized membrane protein
MDQEQGLSEEDLRRIHEEADREQAERHEARLRTVFPE